LTANSWLQASVPPPGFSQQLLTEGLEQKLRDLQ
jgi:hypothetical protein